jgi:hypothetical protein
MLNFNYTLDNELKAPVGQLPGGIQTQALAMALSRMSRKYHQTMRLLTQKVSGTGAAPADGMSQRLPARINSMAASIVGESANAVYQGRLDRRWDTWAPVALKVYGETLRAFQGEVSKAMSNQAILGSPATFAKMAAFAKVSPPVVPNVDGLGGYTSDDNAYLGAFDTTKANPWLLAGAAALAAMWWTGGGGALPLLPMLGGYDDYMDFL